MLVRWGVSKVKDRKGGQKEKEKGKEGKVGE
jgi:hypothetical protein